MSGAKLLHSFKVFSLILILQSVSFCLFGQRDTLNNRSVNELGINLFLPLAIVIHYQVDGLPHYGYPIGFSYRMGNEAMQHRASLTYQKWYFETYIQAIPKTSPPDSLTLDGGMLIRSTDSCEIGVARSGNSHNLTLRYNFEWHFPKEYLNAYYGISLAGGSTYVWRRNQIIVEEFGNDILSANFVKYDAYDENAYMQNFSIGGFAGAEVLLSKRLKIDMHIGIEYLMFFGFQVVEFSSLEVIRISIQKNQFDRFKVFTDISLFYTI